MSGVAAAAIAAAAALGGLFVQGRQNKKLARYQADRNEQYLQKQLDYNTPKMQMERYQDAGLNPNLMYGQGNPGNQSAPIQYPDIKSADYQNVLPGMAMQMQQLLLMQAQTKNIDAGTAQKVAQTSLTGVQQLIAEKNPLLNEGAYNSIIDSLRSAAEQKAADAGSSTQKLDWLKTKEWKVKGEGLNIEMSNLSNGFRKMDAELDTLEQKFNLGTTDQKIKNQILESKEFQNAILEVQQRFMTDGDITPQHIMQFLQLLLMKML